MKDLIPEDYYGKKLRVHIEDGTVIEGRLYGYNYDYDDDGTEFMELDFRIPSSNLLREYRDDEIERIEIIED